MAKAAAAKANAKAPAKAPTKAPIKVPTKVPPKVDQKYYLTKLFKAYLAPFQASMKSDERIVHASRLMIFIKNEALDFVKQHPRVYQLAVEKCYYIKREALLDSRVADVAEICSDILAAFGESQVQTLRVERLSESGITDLIRQLEKFKQRM